MTTIPCCGNPTVPRNLAWSESTNNFSLPFPCDHPLVNNPQSIRSPSPERGLDHSLHALDDMLSSLFIPAILHQDALLHFALPKVQMNDGLQDSFDHLIHFLQIMTLHIDNDALLCKVFPSSLVGPTLSWFHRLSRNTITSFRYLFQKFVTQYMCLVRRKQSVTSLFHV